MRIGIIASARHAIREPFAGGLERHTYSLARQLRGRGHEVTVFASAESDPQLGVEPVCDRATGLDLSEAAEADPSMLSGRFLEEHHAYLDLMLRLPDRNFDLLQNSSLHYLPVAMARTLPAPLVTTLHTPPTPWLESALGVAANDTPTLVSVSEDNAAAWGPIAEVDHVIPNGIEVEAWPFSATPDPGLAVWTGRLVPEKAPHLAVAAAHAAGLRIHLAGPAKQPYFDQEVLPRLRDGDEYFGHLRHAALARLLGKAVVMLSTPRWAEPFGLVVIEALACGTPVAGFDRGALREIIDDSCGRLVEPDDTDALAEAALEARKLSRGRCREVADNEFSLDVMVDRYEDLYRSLAS